VALSDIVNVLRGRPVHPVGSDGRMELSDHLRELRARVIKIMLILAIGFILALVFYHQLYEVVYHPYGVTRHKFPHKTLPVTEGVNGSFMLYMKLCGFAALIGTSPFWLYQIWAFIMPGLHRNEKRWTAIFVSIAGPLFLAGVALGYLVMPAALKFLIGFTPSGVTNLLNFNEYLGFFTTTLLFVGLGFEIPLFIVLLNIVGVLPGRVLGRFRPWIILGAFIFTAMITPTTDPFTMTIMAVPMVGLFLLAEVIARFNDRRRARNDPNAGLDPDEPSLL
jgi:sec-independent protein translocase protein TatC